MNQRYQSASAVLTALRERLTSARTSNPANILETIVTALAESRGYNWTGIYLAVAEHEVLQSASGAAPASVDVAQVNAEIAVPIRLGARTLGLIVAETNRPANNAHQERTLLQQTAKLIAQYFTTDRAKQLLRKTREKTQAASSAEQLHKSPQSARPAVRRAAAGERIPR